MTKVINLSDLKVGDKLPDTTPSRYGYYTNRSISKIRTTKGGRYVIALAHTWVPADGSVEIAQTNAPLSNGALAANHTITIVK